MRHWVTKGSPPEFKDLESWHMNQISKFGINSVNFQEKLHIHSAFQSNAGAWSKRGKKISTMIKCWYLFLVHVDKAVYPILSTYSVGLWRKLSAEELMLLNCGWRRLLGVPWTARRSNQSILKEINPGCSLEGLMLKLKLQYFGHLMGRVDSLEKTLMLGGIGGRRRRGQQRMRWLDGITDYGHEFGWTPGVGDGQGGLACCDSWGRKESDMTELLNWTVPFGHRCLACETCIPGNVNK